MAVEADRVVVELVAQTQGFDTQIKRSGDAFTSTMSDVTKASKGVESAANDVYTAHNKMGIATNNARIAQMELEHVVRGSIDSYASGGNAVQIFAQHIASVAEAATFMGGSLGAVGQVLSGPWGIAITAGVAILATLIARHHDAADSVETLVEKLKKNHEHTLLQNEADERWSHTLDGLLDKLNKLNDATAKRLALPNLVNQQAFADAEDQVARLNRAIDAAESNPKVSAAQIDKLYKDLASAVANLRLQTTVLGTQVGDVFSDLTKRADDWSQHQENKIRFLTGSHPELEAFTAQIEAAFGDIKKAVGDAATAKVPFDAVTSQVDELNNRLAESPGFIKDYIANLRGLAAQLETTVNAAKDAPKAIADFQKAVIGAEGTGANKLGSSAEGFGQFMPSTWLGYFNKLFPDKAELTDIAKLSFRDVRTVAEAVIDSATKDYVALLRRLGENVTAANLYTVHLLGQRDAARFFAASPQASTSSVLSAGVLAGNPFLRGTVADAQAAIAGRIGASSGPVSAAAVAIEKELTGWTERNAEAVAKGLAKEAEVGIVKEHQVESAEKYLALHTSIKDLIDSGILPSLKAWDKEYQQIIDSMAEANRFGAQLVDDILNPDNWGHWGDAAKRVLHEVLQEILLLGAANPLKNLLFGSHLPTLTSIFGQLFGGGGGGGISAGAQATGDALFALPGHASGGIESVGGFGGVDNNIVSINGRPRFRASGDEKLAIIPSNAVAAAPGGGMSAGAVRVVIEASPYFDGRVMEVSGPVIAHASVAAAQGGATIGRRNLGRESMHRLE